MYLFDYHGSVLCWNADEKKVFFSSVQDKKYLPITIRSEKGKNYLYVKDKGYLDVFPLNEGGLQWHLVNSPDIILYRIFFSDETVFHIEFQDKYLSSSRSGRLLWVQHLREWEYFYTFK